MMYSPQAIRDVHITRHLLLELHGKVAVAASDWSAAVQFSMPIVASRRCRFIIKQLETLIDAVILAFGRCSGSSQRKLTVHA